MTSFIPKKYILNQGGDIKSNLGLMSVVHCCQHALLLCSMGSKHIVSPNRHTRGLFCCLIPVLYLLLNMPISIPVTVSLIQMCGMDIQTTFKVYVSGAVCGRNHCSCGYWLPLNSRTTFCILCQATQVITRMLCLFYTEGHPQSPLSFSILRQN